MTEEKLMRLLNLQLPISTVAQFLTEPISLSLCKFSTILRHFNHMSNSQIFVLFKSLVILVQTWIKRYFE